MNEHDAYPDNPYAAPQHEAAAEYAVDEKPTRQWAMVMHLSQLANCVAPPAGLIAPIVIWQLKKDSLPGIDAHGRIIANWVLSSLIYTLIGALLAFVLVGVPLLIILGLLSVAYPIIGGIKANDGVPWRYPGSFRIF